MKHLKKIIIALLVSFIIAGIIYKCLPFIIFFGCLVLDDAGKLDDVDKISEMVTDNQETLEKLSCLMLEQGEEFYINIDADEQTIKYMEGSTAIDEEFIEQEQVYKQLEELYVKNMAVYKNTDESRVVFTTYEFGIAGSSAEKGFIYMPQGMPEDIFEEYFFLVYRHKSCENIVDEWYYFERDY